MKMKMKMKINKNTVGVVGLGYVGLTLATVLAESGYKIIGIEKRKEVVDLTNKGIPHFSETGLRESLSRSVNKREFVAAEKFDRDSSCQIYIITVGTPLDDNGNARLDMVRNASKQVAENMADGALVILRSTLKLGTSKEVVLPILRKTKKKFHLAMCPERTLEGNALNELRTLPQIVGADDEESREKASKFFKNITSSVIQVSSFETAELIKLVDNTYRDVQFGFANEVAKICDAYSLNAMEVISSGKLGYSRTNVAIPGLVGGPCLEKDPHILYQSGVDKGIKMEITKAARSTNEVQPIETTNFMVDSLKSRGFSGRIKASILGLAFKGVPETDDLRGSMSLKVLENLRNSNCKFDIRLYDPVISNKDLASKFPNDKVCASIDEAIDDAMLVVVCNNHKDFSRLDLISIKNRMHPKGFIYDYWNHYSHLNNAKFNEFYYALGNSGGSDL